MNEAPAAQVPPPNAGSGCCGMGCFTLLALIAFFAIAFAGGAMWAVHHYKHKYTASEPITMPHDVTAEEESPVAAPTSPDTISTAPAPVAVTNRSPKQLEALWKAFEKAADRNEKAEISLSAAEINSLLQNSRNTRDKGYVRLENNVARVRFSIPLKKIPMMKNRFLNGEATVKAASDGDPNRAEISSITLSDQLMPDSVIDQHFFGVSSLREVISNWLNKENIRSFRIENDRVISQTGGK
jgi:hypothetical protein